MPPTVHVIPEGALPPIYNRKLLRTPAQKAKFLETSEAYYEEFKTKHPHSQPRTLKDLIGSPELKRLIDVGIAFPSEIDDLDKLEESHLRDFSGRSQWVG